MSRIVHPINIYIVHPRFDRNLHMTASAIIQDYADQFGDMTFTSCIESTSTAEMDAYQTPDSHARHVCQIPRRLERSLG